MREIKFRMWLGGKFHYWGFIKSNFGDDYEFHALADTNAEPLSMTEKMNRSQQYTGLKDKNGVEIYEGDIIRFDNDEIVSVIWVDVSARFAAVSPRYPAEMTIDGKRYEVIGNIYENKELL